MQGSNHATSVIQLSCLLHVVANACIGSSLGSLSSLLDVVCVQNNTDYRLWNKAKKIIVEAIKLRERPGFTHAHRTHIVREDLRVRLKRRPLVSHLVILGSGYLCLRVSLTIISILGLGSLWLRLSGICGWVCFDHFCLINK